MHPHKIGSIIIGILFIMFGIWSVLQTRGTGALPRQVTVAKAFAAVYVLLGVSLGIFGFGGSPMVSRGVTMLALLPGLFGVSQLVAARKEGAPRR